MRTSQFLKPTESIDARQAVPITVLDARVTQKQGRELAELISSSVARTQLFIKAPVPSRLIVTQKQFASLNGYTQEMYETTDRMFMTADGFVLVVQIDREIDVIDEIDDIIQDVEDYEKAKAEEANDESTN